MAEIDFTTTQEEAVLIAAIARRGRGYAVDLRGESIDQLEAVMDITAVHCNGCPLRLQDLIEADDFNFMHDFFGIRNHIDRTTGKLTDCFLPRFAAPEAERVA